MTKKIAVINDLSGFGRCSLTAAVSVLSAMGVQACPLPTAVLTAQTGYPSYYCEDLTDKMEIFRKEWEKLGENFDGIYTGFVDSEEQIRQIFRFLDTFYQPGDNFLLVDPVLGDDGETYDFYTPALGSLMRDLALRADIITPNPTELCLLTDTDYQTLFALQDQDAFLDRIEELGRGLVLSGPADVVVTGIPFTDEQGVKEMGNLHITREEAALSFFPFVNGSYSGTGDLFAAVLTGGRARGDALSDSIALAGSFLEQAMVDSVNEGVPPVEGVNYEKFLPLLQN